MSRAFGPEIFPAGHLRCSGGGGAARTVEKMEKATKQETPTAYIILNRYVLPGPHKLWRKRGKRQNRKQQRQISTRFIDVFIIDHRKSDIGMNTIKVMHISIHNRINCCVHIHNKYNI